MTTALIAPNETTFAGVVFGAARYFDRRDAGEALSSAGFTWQPEPARHWLSLCGTIRANVHWSAAFGRYYVSAVL